MGETIVIPIPIEHGIAGVIFVFIVTFIIMYYWHKRFPEII